MVDEGQQEQQAKISFFEYNNRNYNISSLTISRSFIIT